MVLETHRGIKQLYGRRSNETKELKNFFTIF